MRRTGGSGPLRAEADVCHLCPLNEVARVVLGSQIRRLTNGAACLLGAPANAADDVVVVVRASVERQRTARLLKGDARWHRKLSLGGDIGCPRRRVSRN